jgi:hypothetical protein
LIFWKYFERAKMIRAAVAIVRRELKSRGMAVMASRREMGDG